MKGGRDLSSSPYKSISIVEPSRCRIQAKFMRLAPLAWRGLTLAPCCCWQQCALLLASVHSVRVTRLACAHVREKDDFKVRSAYLHSRVPQKAQRAHTV